MNCEVRNLWEEADSSISRPCSRISMEKLRKITESFKPIGTVASQTRVTDSNARCCI